MYVRARAHTHTHNSEQRRTRGGAVPNGDDILRVKKIEDAIIHFYVMVFQ